jgi:hypothetical protein
MLFFSVTLRDSPLASTQSHALLEHPYRRLERGVVDRGIAGAGRGQVAAGNQARTQLGTRASLIPVVSDCPAPIVGQPSDAAAARNRASSRVSPTYRSCVGFNASMR